MKTISFFRLAAIFIPLSFLSTTSYAVVSGGEVKQNGNVTTLTVPSNSLQSQMANINFSGARAMQMPEPSHMIPETLEVSGGAKKAFKGTPGFVSGQLGNGK